MKRLYIASDGVHASCLVEAENEREAIDRAKIVARFTVPERITVRDVGPALFKAGVGGRRKKGVR